MPRRLKRIDMHSAELDNWSISNVSKLTFQTFIMPVFRLSKYGLSLHPMMKKTHMAMDIISLSFVIAVMVMCHFWYGIIGIVSIIGFSCFLGLYRRTHALENKKITEDLAYIKTVCKINYCAVPAIEPEPKIQATKTTPKQTKDTEIPDFAPGDFNSWAKWIQENPSEIRAKKA
jgi:hypothetical protein